MCLFFVTGSSVRNTDAFQVLQKVFLQVRERLYNYVTFLCFWSFWITRCLFVFDAEHVILPLQYNPWRHQQHLPTRQRQLLPVGGTKHTTTIHRISSLKTTPSSSNPPSLLSCQFLSWTCQWIRLRCFQTKFFEVLEFIVFNLNYVPFKEFVAISILLKGNQ